MRPVERLLGYWLGHLLLCFQDARRAHRTVVGLARGPAGSIPMARRGSPMGQVGSPFFQDETGVPDCGFGENRNWTWVWVPAEAATVAA